MYTKLLLRSILVMLFITEVGFLVLLSGFNPHNIKAQEVVELPTPKFYSVDEVEELLRVTETETEIVVENHVTYINEKEYECLVKNIYFEARNQSVKGKQAIAAVTLTRAKKDNFPKTICGVVSEERKRGVCQFSWKCDGKSDNPNLSSKEELAAWQRAEEIAQDALLGKLDDMLDGVTHFHASYVNPSWARKLIRIGKIGDHIFYKET